MNELLRMTPTQIIIHHSLTADGSTVSWGAIRHYHIVTLGWEDIGYHAGTELVGNAYEIFMGRMWDVVGAHTRGENLHSLGLCFVGNFDVDVPPQVQLAAGARVIRLWMRLFHIGLPNIYPHSHFADKSCPGTKFPWPDFLEMLT